MKMNKFAMVIGAVMAIAAASSAYADGSTTNLTGGIVHFKGELVDGACSVSTDSVDQIVQLGQHPLHNFKKKGDVSELRPFTIKLEDCDTTIAKTAAVQFTGAADSVDANLLAIDASQENGQGASGVGIRILDEKSNVVVPNGAFSAAHNLIDGKNTLSFKAQYVSTVEKPTAGQANADSTFIMQYQ
ncbi:type 1 fimbrial major subunit FimA [Serratia bockelmannii]|uniref:type 1 fimbrial major subunit FimA n=1 Tax=Serratia bockelmannii TaxID=2703793 RepID=UPI0011F22F0D|nr:type 1 fimbrial major subunit FimA [Serratia bockelmannii]